MLLMLIYPVPSETSDIFLISFNVRRCFYSVTENGHYLDTLQISPNQVQCL